MPVGATSYFQGLGPHAQPGVLATLPLPAAQLWTHLSVKVLPQVPGQQRAANCWLLMCPNPCRTQGWHVVAHAAWAGHSTHCPHPHLHRSQKTQRTATTPKVTLYHWPYAYPEGQARTAVCGTGPEAPVPTPPLWPGRAAAGPGAQGSPEPVLTPSLSQCTRPRPELGQEPGGAGPACSGPSAEAAPEQKAFPVGTFSHSPVHRTPFLSSTKRSGQEPPRGPGMGRTTGSQRNQAGPDRTRPAAAAGWPSKAGGLPGRPAAA